ncbi:MAG TPA: hypothetical protein VGP77_05575, partial [Vicinamibacterales bacterium]|nr:hypothetical protein [Vicinamibacterales bacterium]
AVVSTARLFYLSADYTEPSARRPASAAKRPVTMRRERSEYEPGGWCGSHSHRSRLVARGCAAPPDAVSAIGVRARRIRTADLNPCHPRNPRMLFLGRVLAAGRAFVSFVSFVFMQRDDSSSKIDV